MATQLYVEPDVTYGPYAILRPVSPVGTRDVGIIWAPGWRQSMQFQISEVFAGAPGAQQKIIWWLASRYTILVTQRGAAVPGNLWGNAAGVAAIEDAYQVLQTLGCDTQVGLIGLSGGVPDITQWAEENLSNVRGVCSLMGATDLQHLRDTWNVPVFGLDAQQDIDDAWGVTWPGDPMPPGSEPYDAASAFNGVVPSLVWIGDSDTTVSLAGSQQYAANAGSTLHVVPGATHNDGLLSAVDLDELSNLFLV